jgi:cytoskeleton protein RodZ
VNSNPTPPEIVKEAFAEAREKLGLSTKELGVKACLSTRQIEQIESGEMSSFYGAQIKFTAAKKVAKLLNLSDGDAFNYGAQAQETFTPSSDDLPIAEAKLVQAPKLEEEKRLQPARVEAAEEVAQPKESVKELVKEIPEPANKVQATENSSLSAAAESKPKSQKNRFLWLSVIAAAVFAVINLRPLLFADKPEEIIVVKEAIVEPVPAASPAEPPQVASAPPAVVAPVLAAPVVSAEASTACPAEEGIISYKPDAPRKAGDMVYVQVKSKQVICVSDASGKLQNKTLEPGVGASFYGKPPFKVLTAGLDQADVFFQGAKVRLTNPNYKTIVLEAAEVVAPSTGTDSQQR